jgi:hypothetical protein
MLANAPAEFSGLAPYLLVSTVGVAIVGAVLFIHESKKLSQ